MRDRRQRRAAPGDPKRAVAYIRASTDEQLSSPDAQRDAIERWARANGVVVIEWCLDLGVSGGTGIDARPGLLRALGALVEHSAGLLVVAKRDRLARDVVVAGMIERVADRAAARVVAADGAGNGDSPADAFMRTILDGAAAYERALIRGRTKSALASMRARGRRTSRFPPFGYAFDEGGRALVAVAGEQEVALRVRAMHAARVSLSEIARRLNTERVASRGARWYASSIACILRAPATAA